MNQNTATTMINLSQMAIADMSEDQIKTELARRCRIARVNGKPIEIVATHDQLVAALVKAREDQAA